MKTKKHKVVFSKNGEIVKTTPKNWARSNQHCFPTYHFTNNTNDIPITDVIVRYLNRELGFTSRVSGDFVITEKL